MKIVSRINLSNVNAFLEKTGQSFLDMQDKYGINALALAAQCALETGWLAYVLMLHPMPMDNADGYYSYNIFNVGYVGDGEWGWAWVSQDRTVNGITQRQYGWEKMRKYSGYVEALEDLVVLISTLPRYAEAWKNRADIAGYAKGLEDGGYATSKDASGKPNYARSIISTANALKIVP